MAPKSGPQDYEFSVVTFKVDPEGPWQKVVLKALKSFQVVKQWTKTDDGKVTIIGEIDREKVLKCLLKLKNSAKGVECQAGECSTNLVVKKKQTNNNNNNQDMGPIYPCYYNNGYGGYDNYGYGYGYGFPYPTFGESTNYASYNDNTLQCGGHAADCASRHKEKHDTSSTKKHADHKSSTKPENPSSVSFNKLGVLGHKEKRAAV